MFEFTEFKQVATRPEETRDVSFHENPDECFMSERLVEGNGGTAEHVEREIHNEPLRTVGGHDRHKFKITSRHVILLDEFSSADNQVIDFVISAPFVARRGIFAFDDIPHAWVISVMLTCVFE